MIKKQAAKVVDAYIEHSVIVQNPLDPYVVESVSVDETRLVPFKNALHEGYSDLNELEKDFAHALDKTKNVWCRNPSTGGYEIPLLDRGNTRTFNPDFLVWVDKKHIVAIDTKGDHLIADDAARKLFHIEPVAAGPLLSIRLVTEGEWEVAKGAPSPLDRNNGYTVWKLKQGKLHATHCKNGAAAALACLKP